MSSVVQATPRRIHLRRTKGWRLADATTNPNGVVKVDRTTGWGNPFAVHKHTRMCGRGPELLDCPLLDDHIAVDTAAEAVRRFRHILLFPCSHDPWYPALDDIRYELAGKDLACWCGDGPCHADVLLALSNGGEVPA